MSNIYMDIIKAQQRQGNLGGKRETDSERKKREKAEKKEMEKAYKSGTKYDSSEYNITVESGTVYEATDSNGFSDPYITIDIVREDGKSTKQVYRSSVCKKTLSPVWNEKGKMKFKCNVKTLIIQMWDQDLLSSNDFIGGNSISVSEIFSSGGRNFDLNMNEEKEGKIVLKGALKITIGRATTSVSASSM